MSVTNSCPLPLSASTVVTVALVSFIAQHVAVCQGCLCRWSTRHAGWWRLRGRRRRRRPICGCWHTLWSLTDPPWVAGLVHQPYRGNPNSLFIPKWLWVTKKDYNLPKFEAWAPTSLVSEPIRILLPITLQAQYVDISPLLKFAAPMTFAPLSTIITNKLS